MSQFDRGLMIQMKKSSGDVVYRDDMIAQFKQDFRNKNLTLQDQGKDDPSKLIILRIELNFGLI